MPGRFGLTQNLLLALWFLVFVAFFAILVGYEPEPLDSGAKSWDSVKVYGGTKHFLKLDASKAAEFGMEKCASLINYLLLATSAILAFIVKSVMDLRSESAKTSDSSASESNPPTRVQVDVLVSVLDTRSEPVKSTDATKTRSKPPTRAQLLVHLHAGISCFLSLFAGVLAYMNFATISSHDTFALTGELSFCMLVQIFSLLFAVLLMLVGLASTLRDLLP